MRNIGKEKQGNSTIQYWGFVKKWERCERLIIDYNFQLIDNSRAYIDYMVGGKMKEIRRLLARVAMVLFATGILVIPVHAELPEVYFARNYGGEKHDEFQNMIATEDGGYIAIGYTNGNGLVGTPNEWTVEDTSNYEGLAIKYDALGNIEWAYTYGTPDRNESFLDVVERPAGGYVIVGNSSSSSYSDTKALVVAIDKDGNVTSRSLYGTKGDNQLYAIDTIPGGGYIAVGWTNSSSEMNTGDPDKEWANYGAWDGLVIVLDENLALKFANNYGGKVEDKFSGVVALNDGSGFVVVGYSQGNSEMPGDHNWSNYRNGYVYDDGIMMKLNLDGSVAWARNYGGVSYDSFHDIVELPNKEGFVVVGIVGGVSTMFDGDPVKDWNCHNCNADNPDPIVVKTDYHGNVVWANNYGGNAMDGFERILLLPNNEGFLVSGQSHGVSLTPGGDPITDWGKHEGIMDGVVVQINLDGTIAWADNYGGEGMDAITGIAVLKGGDYVFAGLSSAPSDMFDGDPEKNWGHHCGAMDAIIIHFRAKTPPTGIDPLDPPVISPITPPVKPPVVPPTGVITSAESWIGFMGISILGIYLISKKK